MTLNPATQYADDRNLRARQRLWSHQSPPFDLIGWVLDLAGAAPGATVLDVGCGNGAYLDALARQGVEAVGCDLSVGMLRAAAGPRLVNADVTRLPVREAAADVVLAPHMLYHVADREAAARELRRVTRPGGTCVAVTNGAAHCRSVLAVVEAAARAAAPGWELRDPWAHAFSLENGGDQLRVAFDSVTCVRPAVVPPVRVDDAAVVADYVASIGDHYEHEVGRPWPEVVEATRARVQAVIDADGSFTVAADVGAFVCR